MSHENNTAKKNNQSIWYTYFGMGGASVFALLWILLLMFWIFAVLKWG